MRAFPGLCLALIWTACATGPQKIPPDASPTAAPPESDRSSEGRPAQNAFQRGYQAAQKGDLTQAEKLFKEALEREPNLAAGWGNLGIIYERRAMPDRAEEAYAKAMQLSPDAGVAWEYGSRLYCRTGRAAKAEQLLRAGLQKFPESIELRTDLGFVLLHQGQFEPAAAEIKKVLRAEERNLRAMQLLAQVYLAEQKLELAKMVLDNAAAIEPKDPQTHNDQGILHLALKMRPAALEDFKQAVALNPEFVEARNNLGALLNETQDYGSAVQQLQEAVLIAPDFAAARLNLGNAYRGQKQYAKAADEYKRVLQLKPDLVDAYYNLAILHLDSELPQTDAIDRLKTAISYFDQYRSRGGKDARVDAYLKDANKGIEKEQRRRDREQKAQLKKSPQSAGSSEVESKPGIDQAAPTKSPSAKIGASSRSGPVR